ncbi:ATP-binding protein, partial [Sandarakinorhabdus oryzae]|uniref:ATP-binding protein n=1 Tax=Sandarakinorhabdus oryzae TaxID=2675220 RepID=UPI0012E201FB
TIMRAAPAALLAARAAGRDQPTPADVAAALAETPDPRLEGLATRISLSDRSERPQLDALADAELDALARRCTLREALADHAGAGPGGLGVRALFSGPSGTGKTMAARHLARLLGRELWRIDLSAVVSKYIGETEKALDRALAAAESRDIILLLDEGDALMARRTDVGNANDRYANLETNFLLQRLEDFAGIIIVTTNAAERIDTAFARRMDVVVPFRPPDAALRAAILKGLLAGSDVSPGQLGEVAARCTLTGGQLRNIGLHARLLGLSAGRAPGDADLLHAVTREYRKDGGHSPLKPPIGAR